MTILRLRTGNAVCAVSGRCELLIRLLGGLTVGLIARQKEDPEPYPKPCSPHASTVARRAARDQRVGARRTESSWWNDFLDRILAPCNYTTMN